MPMADAVTQQTPMVRVGLVGWIADPGHIGHEGFRVGGMALELDVHGGQGVSPQSAHHHHHDSSGNAQDNDNPFFGLKTDTPPGGE